MMKKTSKTLAAVLTLVSASFVTVNSANASPADDFCRFIAELPWCSHH